jgi:hypothetical protein
MRRTETAGAASADTTATAIAHRTAEEVGSRIPGTRVATEGTAVTTVTTSPIRSATTTRITITRRRPEDMTEHMGGTTVRLGTIAEVTADLVEPNGTITEVDTGVSTEVKTGSVDAEGGTNSASIDGAPVTTAAPSTLTNAAGDPETAETMGDTRTTTVSITAVPTGDVRSTTWAMTTYRSRAARRISFRPRVPAAVSPAG